MVSTVRNLVWELVRIWALSLAHCSSSWCWRRFHMSSTLVCHGSFSMLMTWCSSQTPWRGVGSMHGRMAWKVKGSMSTRRRPSCWSWVLAMISSRNLASTPVLSALVVSATTPSNAHNACCESTRGTVASQSDGWPTQTMSATGVIARLSQ